MRKLLVLAVILAAAANLAASNTYQIRLKSGVWHLVGINGFHHTQSGNLETSGSDWLTISDDNDSLFTYDRTEFGLNTSPANHGVERLSTIGIRSFGEANLTKINYKWLDKNSSKAVLTMFVASGGEGHRADTEVRFQEDYKGKPFYMKFDYGVVMQGVFDPKFTRENPARLEPRKSAATRVSKILDVIDMNLSDNNPDLLEYFHIGCSSLYCSGTNGTVGVGGRQLFQNGDNIVVQNWDPAQGIWKIFDSRRSTSQNDFEEFEAGKSYWIKIDSKSDVGGLILGKSDLGAASYSDIKQGWNMVSFNDGFLRQTPSAVFIKESDLGTGIVLRDNFARDYITLSSAASAENAARDINSAIYTLNRDGSTSWKIRAYPAKKGTDEGIVVISDEDFGIVASTGTLSIAGSPLLEAIGEPYQATRVDEHLLAMELNSALFDSAISPKYAAFEVGFVGENTKFAIDLSGAANYEGVLSAVQSKFSSVSDNVKRTALLIDVDFSGKYKTLLIASSKRFYARDTTFIRIYDFLSGVGGGQFLLGGYQEVGVDYGADLTDTISNINVQTPLTSAIAHEINSTRMLLSSIATKGLQIREEREQTRFFNADNYSETAPLARGAIAAVYSPIALANAAPRSDGSLAPLGEVTSDLLFAPQFSPDFPIDGALYLLQNAAGGGGISPEIIIGGATRGDNMIMWRQTDLTVPIDQQKTALSRYNLFKLQKERGYWVYMSDFRNSFMDAVSIKMPQIISYITRRYSNNFSVVAGGGIAQTRNEINLDFSVDVLGLANLTANSAQMPENVSVTIGGETFGLLKNGTANTYYAEFSGRDIEALNSHSSDFSPLSIGVSAANGIGLKVGDARFYFDNRKPSAPEFSFDSNTSGGFRGWLKIDPKEAGKIYIYEGNLSDTGNDAHKVYEAGIWGVSAINILAHNIFFGTQSKPFYDLRLIGEAANGLQSDARRIFYAPVYKGSHLISVDRFADSTDANSTPIKFDIDGQSFSEVLNGSTAIDSGVQLKLVGDNNASAIAYLSLDVELWGCGTFGSSNVNDGTADIAEIGYCPAYDKQLFYLYRKDIGELFYGFFGETVLRKIDSNQTIEDPRRP
ncbi:hypothetical protein FACS189487_00850 [Campylobacterota bacterium]|nr:hypothetical protein FACS189487_00850 [Campylobacterota bacterium]